MSYISIYGKVNKKAALLLTPEAQAAAAQPPMPPQGAPMDPAMMGAPAGAPPMDPAMAGGAPAPMPPQGAPMDPAMMGAPQGMPIEQAGGIPPGAWMNDPMFMQYLQSMGIQIDPNTGTVIDPNGQPIPPEYLDQMYMEFMMQMQQQMPLQGALMDPAKMGAPQLGMDPNAVPQLLQMAPEDQLNEFASIVMDTISTLLDLKLAAVDKKISAFALKLDVIKNMLDDMVLNADHKELQQKAAQLLQDLLQQLLMSAKPEQPVLIPKAASLLTTNMLLMLRGVKNA